MRYVFGDYFLDTQRYEFWCRGEQIQLRPKVFEVLVYLIRHRQRVVSKDELLEQLWPDQFIGDGSLNACLMAVRRAVGDSGQIQRRIQTLHGRGYRFVAAVEEQEHTPQDCPIGSKAHAAPEADIPQPDPTPSIAASAPVSTAHALSLSYASPQDVPGIAPLPRLDREHKQVTVLCCGLTEAASLAAQLGAEAIHHIMQPFFAQVQATMERYGESMMHYRGDGFMALFGAPVAYEDHARRAILAGVELQQLLVVPQVLPGPQQHRVPLTGSLALHTGLVVIGLVVQAVPHTTQVPNHLQQAIVAKAAGNPFFLGELTWSVVEHGEASLRIPETIHAVLAARSDRLPADTKHLLQLAAVCGTAVAWPLVRAITGLAEGTLWPSLQQLLTAELLSEVSPLSARVYTFKHALIQEVAYQSLLTSTRQTYHQQMAQALERTFPKQAAAQPARVAHHYTKAGCPAQAIDYWHRAGEQVFQRRAHHEALGYLQRGLTLLDSMPEDPEQMQRELALPTTLGPVLIVTHGATTPEVERVYTRPYPLCQQMPETPHRAAVLRGLGYFYRTKGHLQMARTLVEELLGLAQATQDARLLLEASLGLGMVLLLLGEFAAARAHLEQGLARRDAALLQTLPAIPHPVLGCLFYSSFALWYLGYADQARTRRRTRRGGQHRAACNSL